MKNKQKQKHEKKVFLRKTMSLVVAVAIAAGIPGAVYSGLPAVSISAAEKEDGAAVNMASTEKNMEAEAAAEADSADSVEGQREEAGEAESRQEAALPDEEESEKGDAGGAGAQESAAALEADEDEDAAEGGETESRTEDLEKEPGPDESEMTDSGKETGEERGEPDAAAPERESGDMAQEAGSAVQAEEEPAFEAGVLTAAFDDVVVTAEFTEAAALPAGTDLLVRKADPEEDLYKDRLAWAQDWIETRYGRYVVTDQPEKEAADEEAAGAEDAAGESASEEGKNVSEEGNAVSEKEKSVSEEEKSDSDTVSGKVDYLPPTEALTDAEAAVLPDLPGAEIAAFALLDISFVWEGAEIEPQDDVLVTVRFSQEDFAKEENLALVHYGEELEILPDQDFSSDRKGEVEGWFVTGAFSDYAVMALKASNLAARFEEQEDAGAETGADAQEESRRDDAAASENEEDAKPRDDEETEKDKKEGALQEGDQAGGKKKADILPDGELTAKADGAIVTVRFREAAGLPVGTELRVRKIAPEEKGYAERLDSAKAWLDDKYGNTVVGQEKQGTAQEVQDAEREPEDAEQEVRADEQEPRDAAQDVQDDAAREAATAGQGGTDPAREETQSVTAPEAESPAASETPEEGEKTADDKTAEEAGRPGITDKTEEAESPAASETPEEGEKNAGGRTAEEAERPGTTGETGEPEEAAKTADAKKAEDAAAVLPPVPEDSTAAIAAFALFDISLVHEGKEIEPLESVQVTIRFADEEFSEGQGSLVIHYEEEEKSEAAAIGAPPEQEVKSGKDGSVEASFSTDSFSEYAVMAVRANYEVWFDGTDGVGTTNSLVRGATNTRKTTDGAGSVTLPTTAGPTGPNAKYRLNGWYDIYTGNYYKPGERVTVTRNTVFYAEWVQADYNLGPVSTVVQNQPDISSFVRTDVFDYNEIFNPYHGARLTNASWVDSRGHDETWSDSRNVSEGGDFLFTNWYHQYYANNGKYLAYATNLLNGRNKYAGAGDITSNIVSSPDDDLMQALFDKSDAPGKVYLGGGDMLYQYDNNPSSSRYGYYYYDSDKNAADYNREDQRFYIYRNTQTIRGEWNDSGTNVTSFMPFEKGTSTINQKTGQVNFWFGMVSKVNFFLPDNPGSGGNKATGGKDMEFYFSGDDDVWVFVDGVLLLDLGGIHRKINGSINFSDGNIYVEGKKVGEIPDSIKSGDHELQFYYLERGSSWSNASIYFNIAPRYSIELEKSDADHPEQLLAGAVFNVYADEGCTVPAYLWTSQEAYDSGEAAVSTFTTGADGRVSGYGLYANRTYYLKEISSPPGYPSISGRVIALKLNAYGDAVISEGADIASLTQDGATKKIDLSVTNRLPETIDVPVQKHWHDQDGSPIDGEGEIQVELYQAEVDIPAGGGGSQGGGNEGGGGSGSGGSSGGNTGAVLPVNLRTQFFRVSDHQNNGSNSDASPLYPGDLRASTIVIQGGSLTLNLNVTATNAGIYAVTVNGRTIAPVSASDPTPENCLIGGRWGNYPPRRAVYVIDSVEEALDIRVTMIGYLNYGGEPHHPDTSYSMNVTMTATEPPASPGTGGGDPEEPGQPGDPGDPGEPQTPEIPSVMPEGAVLFRTATLSAEGDWQYLFEDLPARTDDGTKLYVYYVKEIYPDGYSTSYIGNGSTGGTVSIYNVRLREIELKKEWIDFNGSPLTEDLPTSIDLILTQYDDTTDTSRQIPVTLTAADGWQQKWRSNSSVLNEQEGHTYRYRVTEVSTGSGYTATYSQNNQAGITEGTITVTNRRNAYPVFFVKADSTDHNITLEGATFSLYSDPDCAEDHLVEGYDSEEETAERKTVFTSGAGGAFQIHGLRPGTYYLKELSAPAGYYLIEYPMEIVITDAAGGVASVRAVRLVDGELTEVQEEIPRIELVQTSILRVYLYDSPLFELPNTGGRGIWTFILSGLAVMLAAALLNIKTNSTRKN